MGSEQNSYLYAQHANTGAMLIARFHMLKVLAWVGTNKGILRGIIFNTGT